MTFQAIQAMEIQTPQDPSDFNHIGSDFDEYKAWLRSHGRGVEAEALSDDESYTDDLYDAGFTPASST